MDVHARELTLHLMDVHASFFVMRPRAHNTRQQEQAEAVTSLTIIVFFSFSAVTTICHSSSGVSASTFFLPICFEVYYQSFHEDRFFPYDPWIQPTKTRLISGQSIY